MPTPTSLSTRCAPELGSPRPASPHTHAPRPPPLPLRYAEGGWLRPQAEEDLFKAAKQGKLATLKRLVEEGVNLDAADHVSVAPPAAPCPLRSSPFALAARRPYCPALTAAAHRVWRRRRASAERRHGRHACGSQRQARRACD
eukprot:scaffold37840_cov58-Phaeocystis_antarctica.AAC.6